MHVGILDLLTSKPERGLYGKLLNANFASVMPQVVAVWAEELGHRVSYVTYAGFEDLEKEIPDGVDILFVCGFTQSAYLAYAISHLYRRRGIVTVLGGPHARSYAEDAARYFDYVVQFTDRELIRDLLGDPGPQRETGLVLSAARHPSSLPGLRARWKFVERTLEKARFLQIVPMLGSLGCPYHCSFCVDSTVRYQPLDVDQVRDDLVFVRQKMPRPFVGWYDPNFGVRFDEIMEVIEESVPRGGIRFLAESSLSLLGESKLERLRRNGFVGALPGIESWYDFGEKVGAVRATGLEKVRAVADHMNLVASYLPYTQANFVLGLDLDEGAEPFELTKRFVDLAPGAFPGYSLFTAFGDSAPLFLELEAAGRLLDIPFPLLDNNSALNVRLKNYGVAEFYDHLIDLVRYSFSPRRVWRRFRANEKGLARWMNVVRAVSSEGRGRYRYHRRIRALMDSDVEFADFMNGESAVLPAFFRRRIRGDLGPFFEHLPGDLRSYLTCGVRPLDRSRVQVLPGAPRPLLRAVENA